MRAPNQLPPAIRSDKSNECGHHCMAVRVPKTADEVLRRNPEYHETIKDRIKALRDSIANNAELPQLVLPAPDYETWSNEVSARAGDRWQNTDWFFAETYFYRLIIEATRWFEFKKDPFATYKTEELESAKTWGHAAKVAQTAGLLTPGRVSRQDTLYSLITASLWGNRMDLSYPLASSRGTEAHQDDLLIDQRKWAAERLATAEQEVHVMLDNAGIELIVDLVLVAALVEKPSIKVILHTKIHPTFVSDAIVADILESIRVMKTQPSLERIHGLLAKALESGRLILAEDYYWNSPQFIWDCPPRIEKTLANADFLIVKGDANYRRIVGDAIWPSDASFQRIADILPTHTLALRTLKSDALIGLSQEKAAKLDAEDSQWRVNGKRGIAQGGPAS